jgi:hypothetical protein
MVLFGMAPLVPTTIGNISPGVTLKIFARWLSNEEYFEIFS